jgi:hypothetical protein
VQPGPDDEFIPNRAEEYDEEDDEEKDEEDDEDLTSAAFETDTKDNKIPLGRFKLDRFPQFILTMRRALRFARVVRKVNNTLIYSNWEKY